MIKTDPNLHTFPPSYFPTTQSPCSPRLVGYTTMIIQLFEPLREWVYKTRRSKGSKKPSSRFSVEGARASRGGCSHPGTA